LGIFEADELCAGVIYNGFDPIARVVELSAASINPRWLTRSVLRAMFAVPFERLGCQMAILRVSEKNVRMRQIAKRFGFSEYLIPRMRGPNEDEAIYTLTVEQWQSHKILKG
ncbi:MAG: GNAT family N-acetyltransferase, partial [Rhizobiaceae bacterium]